MQSTLFETDTVPESAGGIRARDYQATTIHNAFRLYEEGHRGMLIRQFTGGGKTYQACLMSDMWLQRDQFNRVAVFAHEVQLVEQFAEEIHEVLKITPGIEMSERHVQENNIPPITVICRQSVIQRKVDDEIVSRLHKFDHRYNWLVFCDEAHRWALSLKSCGHVVKWFRQNPKSWFVGTTATPWRQDRKTLAGIFPQIVCDYPMYSMNGQPNGADDGWAVPFDQRFITVEGVDFKMLREAKSLIQEEEKLDEVLNHQEELVKLVHPMLDLIGDRKTLIFNPSVDMARNVARCINAEMSTNRGYDGPPLAKSLDGSVPHYERNIVYDEFENGDLRHLSICGLCREGFNNPSVGAIAMFRPSRNIGLVEQMKGRCCRPLRGVVDGLATAEQRKAAIAASEKPNCLLIDMVGVTGLPDTGTTAHLLASGLPDEIIDRANELAIANDGPTDMRDMVERAAKEVQEAREAAERRAQEQADRRARLKAEVAYTSHSVARGHGAAASHQAKRTLLATARQRGYLRHAGIGFDPRKLSKAQASRLIGMHKAGLPLETIVRRCRGATVAKPAADDFEEIFSLFR